MLHCGSVDWGAGHKDSHKARRWGRQAEELSRNQGWGMGSAGSGGYARRFFSGEKADPEVQIIAWIAAPGSTSRERLARLRTLA
jgi:hypothetical protein